MNIYVQSDRWINQIEKCILSFALTSVNDYLIFVANLLLNEKCSNVGSLVTRELQNFSKGCVDSDTTVALESLL